MIRPDSRVWTSRAVLAAVLLVLLAGLAAPVGIATWCIVVADDHCVPG